MQSALATRNLYSTSALDADKDVHPAPMSIGALPFTTGG